MHAGMCLTRPRNTPYTAQKMPNSHLGLKAASHGGVVQEQCETQRDGYVICLLCIHLTTTISATWRWMDGRMMGAGGAGLNVRD